MIRTITITFLLWMLFLVPGLAQNSYDASGAISITSLNHDFDSLKQSFNGEIPIGIQKAMEHRETLRKTKDLLLLDDANVAIFACVALEDSLATLRSTIRSYKRQIEDDDSLRAQNAKRELSTHIAMPDEFALLVVVYDEATITELQAINALKKLRMKMEFILHQMQKNLADAHSYIAFEQSE